MSFWAKAISLAGVIATSIGSAWRQGRLAPSLAFAVALAVTVALQQAGVLEPVDWWGSDIPTR